MLENICAYSPLSEQAQNVSIRLMEIEKKFTADLIESYMKFLDKYQICCDYRHNYSQKLQYFH